MLLCFCLATAFAQQQDVRVIPLWENAAPGAQGTEDRDIPTITVYPASNSQRTGTAVVLAPGGGYAGLAMNHEGRQGRATRDDGNSGKGIEAGQPPCVRPSRRR